jgi:HPt (histidine-containing phosphotransfer) domain-containing protein
MEQKYDLSLLRKLSNNDEEFIIDMLNTFRRTALPIVERMERLISENQPLALGREAHKILPGVSFLGIKYLETDLETMEENAKTGKDLDKMDELVSRVKTKVLELIEAFEKDFKLTK